MLFLGLLIIAAICALIACVIALGILTVHVLLAVLAVVLLVVAVLAVITPFTVLLVVAIANPPGARAGARAAALAVAAVGYAALAAVWIGDSLQWSHLPLIGYLLLAVLTGVGFAAPHEPIPTWTEKSYAVEHSGY